MPGISVAPSPSPVVSAAPPTTANDNGATPTSPAAEGQGTAPFAAVLKQQMAEPATAKTPALKSDIQVIIEAETPQESGPLASLLPMLMSAAGMAPATTTSGDPTTVATPSRKLDKEEKDGTVSPEIAVALAAASVTVTPQASVPAGPPADEAVKPAAMPAANTPAILAATPEVTTKPAAETAAKDGFDALLAGGREINAAALVHAQAASAVKHETPVASARIDTPVGAQGWDAEVGDKLVWMASNKDSRAELVLTPPQLGRIEISLSMSGDQASASFVSANPAVREALENALPRLREILADAGVTLGQAQVGSDSPGHSADRRENGDNSSQKATGTFGTGTVAPLAVGSAASWSTSGRGMVDVFA